VNLPAVLVGGGASALSAARSLSPLGVEVLALGDPRTSPVRYSRHCRRFVGVESGPDVQRRWLSELLALEPGIVLPCTDEALELIARHRADLLGRGHLVYDCDDELALAMLDKERTYALAREVGLHVPRTATVRDETGLERAAGEMDFPCALKPVSPVEFRRVFGLSRKLFVARDRNELRAAFAEADRFGLTMLLTEIVEGPDEAVWTYVTYVGPDGRPLVTCSKRKLRQWPAHFGIGSYNVVQRDEEVIAVGRRFVEGTGLRGFAAVELKRDARDGRLVLIECNQRFVNSSELLRAAGVNLALVAYEIAAGRTPTPQPEPREETRLLFLVEDAKSFLQLRQAGELSTAAWTRSLLHRQRFPVFSLSDPLPSVTTNWTLITGIVRRRVIRAVRGRRAS
jgi:D-aspartate ligase